MKKRIERILIACLLAVAVVAFSAIPMQQDFFDC